MEETKEPYCIDLNDDVRWVVLEPNEYREVMGKGKENMDKALAKARQLNDANEERAE